VKAPKNPSVEQAEVLRPGQPREQRRKKKRKKRQLLPNLPHPRERPSVFAPQKEERGWKSLHPLKTTSCAMRVRGTTTGPRLRVDPSG